MVRVAPQRRLLLGRVALQPLHVEKVLLTSCCAFVSDQILSRKDWHNLVCERRVNSSGPSVLEYNAIN